MSRRLLLAALSVTAFAADARGQEADAQQLAVQARDILKAHCHRCHDGVSEETPYLFNVLDVNTMNGTDPEGDQVLVPGKPEDEDTRVYQRMAVEGTMPPRRYKGEELPRPTPSELDVIRRWIEAGAPAAKVVAKKPREFVSLEEMLTRIRDHLRDAHRDDRKFLRYFTLTNLWNNKSRIDDDTMRLARAALSKALNSLSTGDAIVIPEAIDEDQTIYAVDIRDLNWDIDTHWKALTSVNPYGLKYGNVGDAKDIEEEIIRLSDQFGTTDQPYVRADWFIANATRPPLYHILLDIPDTATALERRLGIDAIGNFHKRRVARAGFPRSGVSRQNRLIERHPLGRRSYYWKSYDFKASTRDANLAMFPLGPIFPGNPFNDRAFVHDGGEIIYSLPNGLQAYMLVDGKDDRIDTGPIEVVRDRDETSGTPLIVNGLSCMACHKHGMFDPPRDAIRDGHGVFGDAADVVEELYPPEAEMGQLIERDTEEFMDALGEAIGPFLAKGQDVREFPEPISEMAKLYRNDDMDLATVAAELFFEDPAKLAARIESDSDLKALGLRVLLTKGGAVKRHDWELNKDSTSLMQDAAKVLEYTPLRMLPLRDND